MGIGGAEKRFIELWLKIQLTRENNNVKLIMPTIVYNKFLEIDYFKNINQYKENIILYNLETTSFLEKRKTLLDILDRYYHKDSTYHFIMGYPIFLNFFKARKYNSILTYTSTSFSKLNFKGLITIILSLLEVKKIDVLDPNLTLKLQKLLFWKKANISNTPSSFVDLDYYECQKFVNKKNKLVFLGRFEAVKQIIKFVNSIPRIEERLKENNFYNYEYIVLGYGSLEKEILEIIGQKNYQDINVKVYFEKNPKEVLKESKVFFSLQQYTNYPSKSLLEAISCGNIPIVTDNRDTRKIAHEDFSYYVQEDFTEDEISQQVLEAVSLTQEEFDEKIEISREFIEKHFSIHKNIEYFYKLYDFN